MRLSALLALLTLSLVRTSVGQQPLQSGQRVRITAPVLGLDKHVATVVGLRGDTLVVANANTMRFPVSSLEQLEMHAGRRSHPWRGAGIGFLSGVGVAFVTWHIADLGCYEGASTTNCALVLGGGIGGAIGALAGAVVGAMIRTDRWEAVPLGGLRVSVVPQRDGFGIGARIAF
jgi:hypothetical protein